MHNPYQTPEAELIRNDGQPDSLRSFPRFSTWFVFLLSIPTLGFYLLWWLYHRTKILNRLKDVNPISDAFVFFALGLNILTLPISLTAETVIRDPAYILFANATSLIASISIIVWSFKFRSRLNTFIEQNMPQGKRLGPV